ncbi:MAG: FG-GAP-like repeat-containing protein [Acidobacteriota bacterium]
MGLFFLTLAATGCQGGASHPLTDGRQAARRHVSRGVAYLAQFLPEKAILEFQAALDQDPENRAATVDLGIAYRVSSDLPAAREWLEKALSRDPDSLPAHYNLALVARLQGQPRVALEHLEKAVALDPRDPDVHYNLALIYAQQRDEQRALEEFDAVLARNPLYASALYGKGRALLAMGREEEAMKALEASQALSGGHLTTTSGQQYGEQGVHSLAIEDMPADPAAGPRVPAAFTDVTASSGVVFHHGGGPVDRNGRSIGSGVAVFDYDGDGDLDLYFVNAGVGDSSGQGMVPAPNGLFRNRGHGRFEDVSRESGLDDPGAGAGVTVGDFDNDGKPDLYLGNWGTNRLFRNRGDGTFQDVTGAAGVGHPGRAMSVAFGDADHDGDLDLVVANRDARDSLVYYRNNGDGTFADRTREDGFHHEGGAAQVLFLDLDADRDIDLLVSGARGASVQLNDRDGSFSAGANRLGLAVLPERLGVVALDLLKDGRPDLVLTGRDSSRSIEVWANEGGAFRPRADALPAPSATVAYGLVVLDYDLDGFADLGVVVGEGAAAQVRLYRNLGRARFQEVTAAVGLDRVAASGARGLQAADLDGDGDQDLVVSRSGESPLILRNDLGGGHHWLKVRLEGLHSNRSGVGTRVAVRAGSLWQQRSTAASGGYLGSGPAELLLGIGEEKEAEAVSVLWPGGVLQDELDVPADTSRRIKELDRKGSSCPTLFGWNGTRFAYVADFIGGGVLGLYLAPGVIYQPDPEELHLIRPEFGLQPDAHGQIAFRLTDNLEEVTYLDRVFLRAVDHPEGRRVLPLEGLRPHPPYPSPSLHLMRHLLNPVEARDGGGTDWLPELSRIDRSYPTFPLGTAQGYAKPHELRVTFPNPRAAGRVWLWGQGTLEFSNSTPHFGAAQHGGGLIWPSLEIREADGSFRVLEETMPVPMGVDKPVLVDLSGRLPDMDQVTLRIRTSMAVYWDRLALAIEDETPHAMRVTDLAPAVARLRPLGFPLWASEDGRRPRTFVYADARPADTWKRIPGLYTRFGPVGELLGATDDRLVVMAPGDEVMLAFDADSIPPLPSGFIRTWFLYGFGWVKDMDLHTPASGQVDPLPFRGMGPFPPSPGAYFSDPVRAKTAARYNTRRILERDPIRQPPTRSAVAVP